MPARQRAVLADPAPSRAEIGSLVVFPQPRPTVGSRRSDPRGIDNLADRPRTALIAAWDSVDTRNGLVTTRQEALPIGSPEGTSPATFSAVAAPAIARSMSGWIAYPKTGLGRASAGA